MCPAPLSDIDSLGQSLSLSLFQHMLAQVRCNNTTSTVVVVVVVVVLLIQ